MKKSIAPLLGTYLILLALSGCRNLNNFLEKSNTAGLSPQLIGTSPVNGANGILANAQVIASFNESIDTASVNTSTFSLSTGGNPVAGTVSCNGTILIFMPSSPLAYDTTYTVTVGIGLKDLAGNALATAQTWTFNTQSLIAQRVYGQLGRFNSGQQNLGGIQANTMGPPIMAARDSGGIYVNDQANNRILYFANSSTVASRVYGQNGDFTYGTANTNGLSAFTLNAPGYIAADDNGLYVSDDGNNRVLYYPSGSTTPGRVYGQLGNLTTATANNGGISADSLSCSASNCIPMIAIGGLYIAEPVNNRVLYYSGASTTASRVYGQGNNFSTGTMNNGGISANSLFTPTELASDAGGIYVSDINNYRVLYFAGTSTTASRVYGQSGSFTTGAANNGGVSANSLGGLFSFSLKPDSSGLYISDFGNSRVLFFAGTSTTASRVYGQAGSFITATVNNGGISADSLNQPGAVMLDASGVYIADIYNNRILYFSGTSTTASRVYGQANTFNAATQNNGGVSSASLSLNSGGDIPLLADTNGFWLTDMGNSRLLYFSGTGTSASAVYGQKDSYLTNTMNIGGVSENALRSPSALATDSGGVLVSDTANHRVLYFSGSSNTATRVYGQGNSFSTGTANNGGISADSLRSPNGLVSDGAGGLYVADSANHRVLFFPPNTTTATRVYGQSGSFTSATANNGGRSSNSLSTPVCVALDASGLYIVDSGNHRVLFYPGTSTTATRVYGQGGSMATGTLNNGGISANSLSGPRGVVVTTGGVLIADSANNRVLLYSGTSTTASAVYGQSASFSTGTANNGGISANSLNSPDSLAIDTNLNLFVSDRLNNRILVYSLSNFFLSGTTATRVYGQGGNFTTNLASSPTISAANLRQPRGLAFDSSGHLYVADQGNSRVLSY